MANIVINTIQYNAVPEIDVPLQGGGTAKFMDTSDATADASTVLSPATFYAGGEKKVGGITSKAAASYEPSTTDQTINAQQYLSGAQTIKKVTTTNLQAQYIASGVTVKVGSVADDDCIASVVGTLSSPVVSQDGVTRILSIS